MTEAVVDLEQLKTEFAERIVSAVQAFQAGGPDLEAEFDQEARALPPEIVEDCRVANAGAWGRVKAAQLKAKPEWSGIRRRWLGPKPEGPKPEKKPLVEFHVSDLAPPAKPPTIEEKKAAIERLADLKKSDPIAYAEGRIEWAERLCTTVVAIDGAVKIVLDSRAPDDEQSQATKVMAIGLGANVRQWHSPSSDCYASVFVAHAEEEKEAFGDGHWENYSIESTAFHEWLLYEYGQRNQGKVEGMLVPQTPGSGAVRDAIAQLKGFAKHRGQQAQPVMRVGGSADEIWIDLGDAHWRSVHVTADGWAVKAKPDVAFVRGQTMLPLPDPVRGGSVEGLRRVINVQPGDFVLVVGWMLQALNPIGPYPLVNVCGASEVGKSTITRFLLGTIDPNSAVLRRSSRKVEDLLIAAKNSWAVSLDNLSWLGQDWSDTLCMISTGISSGTRRHYTNDEEHVYTVQRPIVFNGIPTELTERTDLASRTIKLQALALPPAARRSDRELREEFEEMWPEVFGALLDGLVGALRGHGSIRVADPARLIDFERFAEAGCRAMGFREMEFVEAYAINRKQSLAVSLDTSPVGQAILKFMDTDKRRKEGFAGQMQDLKKKLDTHRGAVPDRDWPKDPTRLSTAIDRIAKALAAVGIDCDLHVDRRTEGGTQKDVVLRWRV